MNVLAQSTQQLVVVHEEEWRFWLMAVIGIATLATMILMPFILGGIRGIKERLNRGDQKFDEQAHTLAVLRTQSDSQQQESRDQAIEQRSMLEKINSNFVEERGSVERLRTEMARDYATKREVEAVENKMDSQHNELMRAIRDLGGRK